MTKSNSIARQGALPQSLSQSLPQSLPQAGEKEKPKGSATCPTKKTTWESVLSVLYPALCLACGEETDKHPGLCSACWGQTHFISGTICDGCGTPLPEVTQQKPTPCFAISACMTRPVGRKDNQQKPLRAGSAQVSLQDAWARDLGKYLLKNRQNPAKFCLCICLSLFGFIYLKS